MLRFVLEPFKGAHPILFGMPRLRVCELLGVPRVAGDGNDSWGLRLEINVGYADDRSVNHVGFSPGEFDLLFHNTLIWTSSSQPDPNPILLRFDGEPFERLGFLVFSRLGITTTGYHDDDPSQYAITVFPVGAWDAQLVKSRRADVGKYAGR